MCMNGNKRTRVAKASVAAVWANCAKCEEALVDVSGSQLLVLDDLSGSEIMCDCCGQANRLPKKFLEQIRSD